MPKIVLNKRFGGYCLSQEAYKKLGLRWDDYGFEYEADRTNPKLVQVVEELGKAANGRGANLKVVQIPDGIEYDLENYDGFETAHEKHRSW